MNCTTHFTGCRCWEAKRDEEIARLTNEVNVLSGKLGDAVLRADAWERVARTLESQRVIVDQLKKSAEGREEKEDG